MATLQTSESSSLKVLYERIAAKDQTTAEKLIKTLPNPNAFLGPGNETALNISSRMGIFFNLSILSPTSK